MKDIDGLKKHPEPSADRKKAVVSTKKQEAVPEEEIFSELITGWLKESQPDFVAGKSFFLNRAKRSKEDQKRFRETARKLRPRLTEKMIGQFLVVLFVVCASFVAILLFADKAKSAMMDRSISVEISVAQASEALEKGDTEEALASLQKAYSGISELKLMAQKYGQDISYLRFSPLEKSSLTANESVLDATFTILDSTQKFQSKLSEVMSQNGNPDSPLLLSLSNGRQKLSEFTSELRRDLRKSSLELDMAAKYQDSETKAKLAVTNTQIDSLLGKFALYEDIINTDLPWLLGENGQSRRILIVFQNNSELRGASGGSLGSFAVANFSNGEMKSIDFGKNIFKLDQAFEATNYIAPPDELKFLRGAKSWTMKDSGWSVDGGDSYNSIMDFYTKETGDTVDGAIMIDTTAVSSLLAVTGPIEMSAYGKTISSDNFRTELEKETHEDYWTRTDSATSNEPKQIISDMIPLFIPKVMSGLSDKNQSLKIISAIGASVKSKDILITSKDSGFQEHLSELNLSGQVAKSVGDYIYVNNSNIDGGKSSLAVVESLALSSTIGENGEVNNSLVVVRDYPNPEQFALATNTNFSRLLVADGSEVKNFDPISGDFEQFHSAGYKNGQKFWVEDALGKKMINFWLTTKPGSQGQAKINFKSGYKVATGSDFTYVLTIQKQPGANPDKFKWILNFPSGYVPLNVRGYDTKTNSLTLETLISSDATYRIKFQKR